MVGKVSIWAAEVSNRRARRGPSPSGHPQHRVPVTERALPMLSGCENRQGLQLSEREGCLLESQVLPLRGQCTDYSLTLTCSELQHWIKSLNASNLNRGPALSGFTAQAGGAAFSEREVRAEATVFFFTLPHPACYLSIISSHVNG